MENNEKIICKSKTSPVVTNPPALICFIVAILGFIAMFIIAAYYQHKSESITDVLFGRLFGEIFLWFILGVILFAGLGAAFLFIFKPELAVTESRIYGKIGVIKAVNLPMNQISSVGTGMLKSLTVATSSGFIRFYGIINRDEITTVISGLLAKNQKNVSAPTATTIIESQSNADELKKYKDLLDSGIITQEEFDAKKKQLLGL